MNKKDRRARILRIVIDAVFIAAEVFLLVWLKFVEKYDGDWIPVILFSIIITVSKVLHDTRVYVDRYMVNSRGRLSRVVKFIFRPFLTKIEEKREQKKKYLKGRTERKFVFRTGRQEKKPRFDSRIKANLKKCRTNRERLRMMYIRGVLELRADGHDVTPSKTPRELEKMLSKGGNRTLFRTYARMRYEEDFTVDDRSLEECENK